MTLYISHNVPASIQVLLNLLYYPDRFEIGDYTAKTFPKMIKYLYRILAHIYFYHKFFFNKLEEKIKIYEHLTLYV
jgi:hypothetical protein